MHDFNCKVPWIFLQKCRNFCKICSMSLPAERFQTALQQAGYSLSKPRVSIFNVLLERGPQSMRELAQAIPDIDRSSIYRVVTLFEELQIVTRLQIGWKYKIELSDQFSHHHHHAICTQCGKIVDLPENTHLESDLQQLSQSHNFLMHDHQLEIRGLCADCRAATIL